MQNTWIKFDENDESTWPREKKFVLVSLRLDARKWFEKKYDICYLEFLGDNGVVFVIQGEDFGFYGKLDITHWQPLPEDPI